MHGISCDRCGKGLLIDEDVRYTAELTITAAYDVMEVTQDDLARASDPAVWQAAVRAAEQKTARELEEEIYCERRYDLCPPCRRTVLKNPFPTLPPAPDP